MPGASGPEPLSDWMLRERDENDETPSLYYLLRNLDPDTWYQLEVTALNNIGWSKPNDLFCFSTAAGKYTLDFCFNSVASYFTVGAV